LPDFELIDGTEKVETKPTVIPFCSLRDSNENDPNESAILNFDVSTMPQIRDSNTSATFGKMNGLAVAKNSDNIGTAINVAVTLAGADSTAELTKILGLPPVRRDLLAQGAEDAYRSVFYDSAIISRGWLDPNAEKTYTIFKDAVEGITSGRLRVSEAVSSISAQISEILRAR